MKKKSLWSAIALIGVVTFLAIYLRLQKNTTWHGLETQGVNPAESHNVIGDAIAAGRRRSPQDLSAVQIYELARTPIGRLNLCGTIGQSALVGLSDTSYQQVLVALSDVESLEDICLREIALRLGNELNEPPPPPGYSSYHSPSEQSRLYSNHRSLEVGLLMRNQDLTANFIREEYSLGTGGASRLAIPLLITLHDRKSCPDIVETIQALHKSNNDDWRTFEKAQKSICK